MAGSTHSLFHTIKSQLAYYKKQTAALLVVVAIWGGLLAKHFAGKAPTLSSAAVLPQNVGALPQAVQISDGLQDGSDDSGEPAPILAYWEDLHTELERNPFDSQVRPSIQMAVNDEDKDGIRNEDDLCPATPRGTVVDANGCPDRAPTPEIECNSLYQNLHLMGTIKPQDGRLRAGAIINDLPYKVGDRIRNHDLELIEVMDQDSVQLRDRESGRSCILKTERPPTEDGIQ